MDENKLLLKNSFASISLTYRLAVVIILFAILLSIAISAEKVFLVQISEQQVGREMQMIEKSALLLYRSGGAQEGFNPGSLQVFHLQIPESMSYAAFGAGGGVDGRSDSEANLYYYKLKDGRIQSFSSNVMFCSAKFENGTPVPLVGEPAILGPGSYDVYLELIRVENQTYVMIFQREHLHAGQ